MEEVLKDFKKKQPNAPTHIRRVEQEDKKAELLMTSDDNSTTPFTPSQEGHRLPAKIAEAFLSW